MANLREVKLIEREFLELSKENKNDNFEIKNNGEIILKSLPATCRQLVDNCRQLPVSIFFQNLNKKFDLKLKDDSNLEIIGCGILNIIVEEDLNLELNFNSKDFSNLEINIRVLENKKLNLIDFTNSKNLYKNIEIILEKNSTLNTSQFILNSKRSHSNISLNENSNYNLKSVYYGDDSKNYIQNRATHLGKGSKSNLEINGLAKDNSKIINDAIVVIEKDAEKSVGHQKMKNLILDKSSQIQSEPILEVKNNNVICSHGSSISQISDQILFYMNSRGVSKVDAISLISVSYFNQVINSIKDIGLQKKYDFYFNNFKF